MSVYMRKKKPMAAEAFTRLTWRVTDALLSGELNFTEHGLLVFLIARIEKEDDRKLTTSLALLKEELGWTGSTEWLRQNVQGLRRRRWIDVAIVPGGRQWRIWLDRGKVVEEGEDPATPGQSSNFGEGEPVVDGGAPPDLQATSDLTPNSEDASELELSSNSAENGNGPSPDEQQDREVPEPPTALGSPEAEPESDKGSLERDVGTRTSYVDVAREGEPKERLVQLHRENRAEREREQAEQQRFPGIDESTMRELDE